MIVFRQLDDGYTDPGIHWHVEYFDDPPEHMFPIATAYVVAVSRNGTAAAQLNFILVADAWRRRGIASALVRACRERWPNLYATSALSQEGAALLSRTMPELHSDQDDD